MPEQIKRFYQEVSVRQQDGVFLVELDGRPVKSPSRRQLDLPSKTVADALAGEWRRQKEFINAGDMPVMRFAGFVSDHIVPGPQGARAEISKYARSDLLCYRADGPDRLAARQKRDWDPVLEKFERHFDIRFKVTTGIGYVDQDPQDMQRFEALLEEYDGYDLGALHLMTTLMGSACLAISVAKGWLTAEHAWSRAHLDEDFQSEFWGEDLEAAQRRQFRFEELRVAALVFN